jgi:hypothetical protein
MKFDRPLGAAKLRPGEKRQAKRDNIKTGRSDVDVGEPDLSVSLAARNS